ncbi:MAG: anti-sigma factor antagonist [Anaerolineaceae bacterium]|nr:anti-sigma factor antagonist [Anaerolineaceae bacterium]
MNVNVSKDKNTTLIEVSGRIDSTNANQLGEALMTEINAGNIQLVVDLASVDYMSSAGLREIVSALKKVRGKGDLRLARPSERVLEVLEMAGLDTIFQIFPDQALALSSYV